MKRSTGQLRIIGGDHRSRIVEFDGESGVRPTPDRVRQTLFDWLAPMVEDSRCLDLFAGSGALGFEALSRGAAHVRFTDIAASQVASIRENLERLGLAERGQATNVDGIAFLAGGHSEPYDIVFLDPPFRGGLLGKALKKLPRVLAPVNRVYFECEDGAAPVLPPGYELLREKKAGQVSYGLATFTGASA